MISTHHLILQRLGLYLRNGHKKLLINIAGQLGLNAKSLLPRLLDDRLPDISLRFIQSHNVIKVDLTVERELHGWSDVVRMIVLMVVVAVARMFVVAVGHDAYI